MIEELNKHLALEMTAHETYNGYAKIFAHRQYPKLAAHFEEAASEELGHFNAIVHRILQLGGWPDAAPKPEMAFPKKWDVQQMFEHALDMERAVLASLSDLAEQAEEEEKDFETFTLLQGPISETESDIEMYTTSLLQMKELGMQNYLQAQM